MALLCFSTLNKKVEVKFERLYLPEQACESDVLTTTLSDLVEKRGSHRHLYSRFAHCQFKEELVVHSRTKTLKKPARNKSMNIPMWTFKVFNN